MERWAPVPGYEGLYEVSDQGRVRSLDRVVARQDGRRHPCRGQMLTASIGGPGYPQVSLGRSLKVYVHRLVLEAFVGPCPAGMECLHDDGDKENPKLTNLRWGTSKENKADAAKHGRTVRGEKHHQAKLTEGDIHEIRDSALSKKTQRAIAKQFGVGQDQISRILSRKRWAHVPTLGESWGALR